MAKNTEHYGLVKPAQSDFYNVDDFNGNADIIDSALQGKVDKVSGKGLSANDYTTAEKAKVAAAVSNTRKVNGKALSADVILNAGNVGADTAGAAAAVQTNLNGHTANRSNPHGVTYQQVGADASGAAANVQTNLNSHTANKSNPHGVTAAQLNAASGTWVQSILDHTNSHINSRSNPHGVTYAQARSCSAYSTNNYWVASVTPSQFNANQFLQPGTVHSFLSKEAVASTYGLAGVITDTGTLWVQQDEDYGNGITTVRQIYFADDGMVYTRIRWRASAANNIWEPWQAPMSGVGHWSASVSNAASYARRDCRYVRIGKLVIITYAISCTTGSSVSGGMVVSGLPFVVAVSCGGSYAGASWGSGNNVAFILDAGGNTMRAMRTRDDGEVFQPSMQASKTYQAYGSAAYITH